MIVDTAGDACRIRLPSGFNLQEDEDFVYLCEGELRVAIFSACAPAVGLVAGINDYLRSRDVRTPLAYQAVDQLPLVAQGTRVHSPTRSKELVASAKPN